MSKLLLSAFGGAFAAILFILSFNSAEAAEGYATADVNVRAGPGTGYPAVDMLRRGEDVEVLGCLASRNWCDVAFDGNRGWVSGRYIQVLYERRRIYLEPSYYRPLHIPVVVFDVGDYWDRYYRDRPFYGKIHHWRRYDRETGPARPVIEQQQPWDEWPLPSARPAKPVRGSQDGEPCFGCVEILGGEDGPQPLPCPPDGSLCTEN